MAKLFQTAVAIDTSDNHTPETGTPLCRVQIKVITHGWMEFVRISTPFNRDPILTLGSDDHRASVEAVEAWPGLATYVALALTH